MFRCNDGGCVPRHWRCDSDRDCKDGSDEMHCDYAECSAGEFRCGNGRLVLYLDLS